MMRALKFIGFALLALVLLAALAAAVAVWRFDPAWAKQQLTQAVYERNQRVLTIDGVPALSFFPSIGVRMGKASLSERGSSQEFASVDNARVSVRVMPLLSRQVVVDRVELDGVSARVVRHKNGKFNFDDLVSARKEPTPAAAQGTPILLDVAGVAITRSSILFRDEKAGRDIRVHDLSVKTGRLARSASGPFELAFRADGEQRKLKLAGTARGNYRYDLARDQFAMEGIEIGIKGDAFDAKVNGTLQANLKDQTAVLPKVTGELQLAHPQLPGKQLKLPLDASVRVDWGKSQAAGEWSTRFDESSVKGKFQVARFAPLAAAFDVAIDRLDMDAYLPPTASAKGAPAPDKAARANEPAEIDFSFLRGLNLKAALRVGFLRARNLKFDNLTANLVAVNGRLELNPLTADFYGGRLTGSLTAQADGNRLALRQNFSNVQIGSLIKDYAQKDILEGRGQVALDVSATGHSAAAMRQSLNGSASLNVRDGAFKGINLANSLRQYKSIIQGGKQNATVAANKSEKTDFSELAASFRITNGVARNDDLAVKSPLLRLGGAGTIDLVREQLDYLAKVTVQAGPKGEGLKELADLDGLSVPVRLTGPIDDPSYRLEFGVLAEEIAKQQVQKQLGQQVEKALGKKGLGDALKALIR